jgi:hypothetical protein
MIAAGRQSNANYHIEFSRYDLVVRLAFRLFGAPSRT